MYRWYKIADNSIRMTSPRHRRFRALFLFATLLLLNACAGNKTSAPISDYAKDQEKRANPTAQSGYRTVTVGDTLYSIAWDAGRNYKEVAAWNNIAAPYKIYPGQQLRIAPPQASTKKEMKGKETAAKSEGAGKLPEDFGSWAWPAEGKAVRQNQKKGLVIAGQRGQSVRAAANGRVVYQGSGLRGYGQLIILKHNDDFLSAYAHNDKVYVKEGDVIKRGQRIAEMGSTGADRVKLHFEIRRRGVPVDPLQYLPKR